VRFEGRLHPLVASRFALAAAPADEAEAVIAADEQVVGDVEIVRPGELGPDAEADVFKAAVLDGEADGAGYLFLPGEDRNVGVTESQAFKDVIGL